MTVGRPLDLAGDHVHSYDLVSILDQTGGGDTSDITETKYTYVHFQFPFMISCIAFVGLRSRPTREIHSLESGEWIPTIADKPG